MLVNLYVCKTVLALSQTSGVASPSNALSPSISPVTSAVNTPSLVGGSEHNECYSSICAPGKTPRIS